MQTIMYLFFIAFFLSSCRDDSNPIKSDPVNLFAQEEIHWPSLQKAPWPMYRHDPQLTGRSQFSGPSKGIIVDTINHSETFSDSEISIGVDGRLFFSTSSTATIQCYSISAMEMLWKAPLSTRESFCTPTLLQDNDLIHVSRTGIRKFSYNGTVLWKYSPSSPTDGTVTQIDKNGNIYCIGFNQTLYKISSNGSLVWSKVDNRFFWGASASPSLSPDGKTLYAQGTNSTTLLAVNTETGEIRWTFGSVDLFSSPVIDNNGNVYALVSIGNNNATLYCIKPDGQLRWDYTFTTNGYLYTFLTDIAPTIDKNGNIYLPASDTLCSLTNEGTVRWKQPLNAGEKISIDIVSDNENNIYIGTSNKRIISYSASGTKRWEISINKPLLGNLSINNSTLIATAYPKEIYVIK